MDPDHHFLEEFKKIGLSGYEARAYLSLLEYHPVNGYALSKYSGIPRSRIYDVLGNLMEKQLAFEQQEGASKRYYPVEPEIFIEQMQSNYRRTFAALSEITRSAYQRQREDEKLVVLKGRRNIIDFSLLLIQGARQRLAVSIWEEDFEELHQEIDRAVSRGVVLRGIYFGPCPPYRTLVSHRRLERYIAEKKQRFLSIVIDSSHTLSGVVSKGTESRATWTRDQGFIEISEDYIAHDLLVNLYSASLDRNGYEGFEAFADRVLSDYFRYTPDQLSTYRKLT